MQSYRTFKEAAPANELRQWLQQQGIEAEVQEIKPLFDRTYMGDAVTTDYLVKIHPKDFEQADNLLVTYYRNWSDLIPKDYYLYAFNDDELYDILKHPDQWGDLDYALAQDLLQQHGRQITGEDLTALKQARIAELKQPERDARTLIQVGFGLSVFTGLIGSLVGWYLANALKTLPDGSQVHVYEKQDRDKGRVIFKLGIFVTIIITVIYLFRSYTMFVNHP